ncbi:MAG: response regulator [Rhodopseudomonas palustris]|nr:response regulator [Rhodopseudomonas palustris]
MDVRLPVLDGFEATKAIRRIEGMENLPIIALTAHALESDRETLPRAGMTDHLGKHVDPETLFAAIVQRLCPGQESSVRCDYAEEKRSSTANDENFQSILRDSAEGLVPMDSTLQGSHPGTEIRDIFYPDDPDPETQADARRFRFRECRSDPPGTASPSRPVRFHR